MVGNLVFPFELLIKYLPDTSLEARRLFHGRGDFVPDWNFLNIDVLAGHILIILYEERDEHWRLNFANQITEHLSTHIQLENVLFQLRYVAGAPVVDRQNKAFSSQVDITECGLSFRTQIGGRQNTGFFTDMSSGHQWVRDNAEHRKVLNLFSYTCAFSVVAIAGGAEHVLNMDMNSSVLSQGRENHRLNDQRLEKVAFQKVDIMKSWGRIKRNAPYDLIIIDPPSFQKGSFKASRDYPKLMRRIHEWLGPKADVICCLNQPEIPVEDFKLWIANSTEHLSFIKRIDNIDVLKELQPENGLKVLHYQAVV